MQEQLHPALPSRGNPRNGRVVDPAPPVRSEPAAPRLLNLRRASFAAATAFLSINLWTGSPLLALWVGSQAAGEQMLSMTSVFVVVLTFAALSLAISAALLWLEERYRVLVGLPGREARLTWLRPFNAQREAVRHVPTSMLERIVTLVVYVAVILFLVWFFFFAGSPLGEHGPYA
jgi:hypothetical protein